MAGGLLRDVASAVFENVKDPRTQGRIVGWVLEQVAVSYLTAGAANAIKAGKLASIASKLDNLPFLANNPKLLQALKTAFSKAEVLAGRKLPAAPSNVPGNRGDYVCDGKLCEVSGSQSLGKTEHLIQGERRGKCLLSSLTTRILGAKASLDSTVSILRIRRF